MELISTKTIVSTTVIEKYALNDVFGLTVIKKDGAPKEHKLAQEITDKLKRAPRGGYNTSGYWMYVKDGETFRERVRTTAYHEQEVGELNSYWWQSYIVEDIFTDIDKYGFDPECLIYNEHSSYNFRDHKFNYLDMLFIVEGVCLYENYRYTFKGLKEHLEKQPTVVSVVQQKVPSYNSDFSGQKQLILRVVIPSKWRNQTKNESWQIDKALFYGRDPLKLKKFEIEKYD